VVPERDGAAEAGDACVALHGEDEVSSGSGMIRVQISLPLCSLQARLLSIGIDSQEGEAAGTGAVADYGCGLLVSLIALRGTMRRIAQVP